MTKTLQLALIHANPIVQQGVRCLIEELPFPVEVVCCFPSLSEALKSRRGNDTDALIAELGEPAGKNAEILLWLQRNTALRALIVITGGEDIDLLLHLLTGRRISLLSRREPEEAALALIGNALQGKSAASPLILQTLNHFPYAIRNQIATGLTETERRILKWLLAGYGVLQIASQTRRSVKTVSTHKRNIMKKLHVATDAELFAVAGYAGAGQPA